VIERFQLLRNIGQFDSVSAGALLPVSALTLIYAENGRGKTTLAAILRSLGTGIATPITERRRLSATHPPHIVVSVSAGASCVFQNGAWSATFPQVTVFDDTFVSENVCSGIEIGVEHRQHLHELILGAQGVSLNSKLQDQVARVEEHNRALKAKGDAIPAAARGTLAVDAFCALIAHPNIDSLIREAERALAAAKSAEAVKRQENFAVLNLPAFDTGEVNALLKRDLPDLEAAAAALVQSHLDTLGAGAETWVAEGMPRIASASKGQAEQICPFCAQELSTSPVIDHYRAYFSEGYSALKTAIANGIKAVNAAHGGDAPAAFERAVRVAIQQREFWGKFAEVPEVNIDTAVIARAWKAAREAVLAALSAKRAAPLDPLALPESAVQAIANYDKLCAAVNTISGALQAVNTQIALVKERAASANVVTLTADLAKHKATRERHSATIAPLCQTYLDEKAAKKITEGLRDTAREALDVYRQTIFPAYEAAINGYLKKFNAGFRLSSVTSVNNRAGSSCSYSVLINNIPVALTDENGGPCFRNTLSAGDRNTLALALFFASLDRDPQVAQKTVVIDDPMTSLDEHRSLTTVQQMRRLADRVQQVIVMSHSKPFLCSLWQEADSTTRAALKIARDGSGSTFAVWDVNRDCVTEHDRRHAMVGAYIQGKQGLDDRAVAAALRQILEAFMRVAYPAVFPPSSLLGPFLGICAQRKNTPAEILAAADIIELRDLLDYANKFHHETNAAWETEAINDQELLDFCKRTLAFAQRG
jgi:wobble nucleotide-excising tRNase